MTLNEYQMIKEVRKPHNDSVALSHLVCVSIVSEKHQEELLEFEDPYQIKGFKEYNNCVSAKAQQQQVGTPF